jgi:hypothetical protein
VNKEELMHGVVSIEDGTGLTRKIATLEQGIRSTVLAVVSVAQCGQQEPRE